MSLPRAPKAAKLVMSFLYREEEVLAGVLAAADGKYGPLDFLSEALPFEFTSYYEAEMGKGLKRRLAGFRPLIQPEHLPGIKLWANIQENQHLDEKGGRKINIDPGYLASAKFILATGKDYSHRIYLGERYLRGFDPYVSERIVPHPPLDLSGLRLSPADRPDHPDPQAVFMANEKPRIPKTKGPRGRVMKRQDAFDTVPGFLVHLNPGILGPFNPTRRYL
jgi:hypothetical protein